MTIRVPARIKATMAAASPASQAARNRSRISFRSLGSTSTAVVLGPRVFRARWRALFTATGVRSRSSAVSLTE
jgi:hypothetical protein